MSRQVKIILIVVLSLLLVVGVAFGAVKYVQYKQTETVMEEKTRQIEFLKTHETEMTEYVKKQNSKITSVQYDWNSVETGIIGNGLPQGAGTALYLDGFVNDNKSNEIDFYFVLGSNKLPNFSTMEISSLMIDGKYYE
ncbi:MAG: hypothetical protein LKI77_02080 [Bifidobacterium sp.]|jgi:predicted carbohydrate-binding protein with CBM5 and CBM33 domain|nr:hypothetical protein [Bifidobacterium sp.]